MNDEQLRKLRRVYAEMSEVVNSDNEPTNDQVDKWRAEIQDVIEDRD
jgi:hypothetical protein